MGGVDWSLVRVARAVTAGGVDVNGSRVRGHNSWLVGLDRGTETSTVTGIVEMNWLD